MPTASASAQHVEEKKKTDADGHSGGDMLGGNGCVRGDGWKDGDEEIRL
jgi:hypothetical protein